MMVEENYFNQNQDDSTHIYTKEEEDAILRNILTPCFQRMDSSNSIKASDIYFIKPSSKTCENFEDKNVFNQKESFGLMADDFDREYNSFFNKENKLSEENNYCLNNQNQSQYFLGNGMNNSNVALLIDNETEIIQIISGAKKVKEGVEKKFEKKIGIEKPENKPPEEPKGEPKKEESQISIDNEEKPMKKKSKRGKRGPYKKNKTKLITETDTNDKCFPFIKSKSVTNNTQFITNKHTTSSDGTQKREKKARKYKPDDIRKKIKVRFHKKIKNIINENLKKAGSNKLFSFLPQLFLGNISKKFNYQYMNKTFEELLSTNFSELQEDYPNKDCDLRQFEKNKETLKYLEENPKISEISGFNVLKKMKYKDILRRYFSSIEFEQSIKQLEKDNEDNEYIQEYICLAKNYIDYFMDINNCK